MEARDKRKKSGSLAYHDVFKIYPKCLNPEVV